MSGAPAVRPKASEQDRALAAEYVLGTLDRAEREAARRRLRADESFAGLVRNWERRLAPLHELSVPVAPPPTLLGAILAALPPPRAAPQAPPTAAPVPPAMRAPLGFPAAARPSSAAPTAARSRVPPPPSVAVRSAAGSRAALAAVPEPPPLDRAEALKAMSEAIEAEWEGLLAGLDQLEAELRSQMPGLAAPDRAPDRVPGRTVDQEAGPPAARNAAPPPVVVAPSPVPGTAAPPAATQSETGQAAPQVHAADQGAERAPSGAAAAQPSAPEPLRAARIGLLGRIAARWRRAEPAVAGVRPPQPGAEEAVPAGADVAQSATPEADPLGAVDAAPMQPPAPERTAADADGPRTAPGDALPDPPMSAPSARADGRACARAGDADPPDAADAGPARALVPPDAQPAGLPPQEPAQEPTLERAREPAQDAAQAPGDASVAAGPFETAPAAPSQVAVEPVRTGADGGWPAVAAVLAIVAVGLAGMVAYRQWIWPRMGDFVAILQPQATPAMAVRVDPESGVVFVRAFAPPPPEGMAYQLWLRPKGERAVRLGDFSSGLAVRAPALGAVDRSALRTATVAVTLGPANGAGTGAAPGTVVFEGRLVPE